MKKVTNEDIANYTNKKTTTINHWKRIAPGLLDLCRIGAFCKKNNLDIEKITKLVEIQEAVKGVEG